MQKYKVLLADDEAEIREGIIKKIDWDKYGFEIIGSAENGKEALEIAELMRPDIVMTDVMMPFMDGLELGEQLARTMPATKLILFSGADDFEFVQRALKMQAVEYVLKPIDAAELGHTLEKLKEKLDQEFEAKRNVETLRQHYIDSIPVIKEQFLVGLADGRVEQEQVIEQCGIGQLDLEAKGYTIGLLQLEANQQEKVGKLFKNHDTALVPTTIRQIAEEVVPRYVKSTCFYYGDTVGVLANLYEKNDIFLFVEAMDFVCKEIKRLYGLVVTAGIGTVCDTPSGIRYARKEAQTALTYKISVGAGQAIYLGDVEPKKKINLQFQGSDERELLLAVKTGEEDKIRQQVEMIFQKFKEYMLTSSQIEVYLIEIKVAFIKLIQYYCLQTEEVFGKTEQFFGKNLDLSLEESKEKIIEKGIRLSKLICESRINSRSAITLQAKEYVWENYPNENLSVDSVSQILHVSSNYFSSLFKKEMGVSFISFLTGVRMKKAVELLEMTDDKSYMIAEKVGYTDANYFSYVFKKHFGVSPQRYRKRKIEDNK